MKEKLSGLFFALAFIFILSCGPREQNKTIVIAGSTSIQPFVEGLSEIYSGKHKDIEINVQSGGSSAGIQSAQIGIADLGMASRELKGEEKELKSIIIAYDAIAVIVNPSNPMDNISIEDIRKIFSRQVKNWKGIGGPDKEINAITREDGSGTRGAFQKLVMGEVFISNECNAQDSNGSVREMVKADQWSIGYISLGLINKDVKALKIENVFPDDKTIDNKKYNFVRPFLLVYKNELQKDVKDFVDFILSDEGQSFLVKEGLVSVKG